MDFSLKQFLVCLKKDVVDSRILLPTLPHIAMEALVVVNDDDSSVRDLATVIAKDASMATRLVRYANSPLYRGVEPVPNIRAAISRIGFSRVKQAIYALSMKEVFATSHEVIQRRMERLWKHSVDVATRSAMLAGSVSHLDPEKALLAGLIHDVGAIPVLLKSKDYGELYSNPENLEKVIHALHTLIGRDVLNFWKFDQELIDVVANHERLDREPSSNRVDYVDVVQVANVQSHQDTSQTYAGLDPATIPAFRRLGVDRDEEPEVEEAPPADDTEEEGLEALLF